MSTTDVSKLFISLGLSATETKVYLSALKLGATSIQNIAKRANLSRTATYETVSILTEHGLISSFMSGKKRLFAAEDPEQAVTHFKQQLRTMENNIEVLERVLPEIKMSAGGEKPTVRFYEGDDAVYALFRDFHKYNKRELYELSNYNDIYEFLDSDVLEAARSLAVFSHLTILRILHTGEPRNHDPKVHCRLLPEFGEFHGDIWIYANRVAFVAFVGKVMTVIIESQVFADTARVLFNAAWKVCTGEAEKK